MNILKACTGIMWLGKVSHPERLKKMFSEDVGTNSNSTLYSVHVKIYVYLLGVRPTVPRAVS